MNCTKCGGEIRRGEEYVALNRHVEVERGRRFYERPSEGVITVKDAENLATYHRRCEPAGAFQS